MRHFIHGQQRKAGLYFALIVCINLAIVLIIVTGIITGMKGYIGDTRIAYESATCSGSICSKCFFSLHTLTTVIPWVCLIILFTGIYLAIRRSLFMLYGNQRFIQSLTFLPVENYPELKNIISRAHLLDLPVYVFKSRSYAAFTSGIWKPKISLSTGICSYLTSKELLSVILHEKHHKENKAPLRLVIIRIFCALNFFLPVNRYLLNMYSSAFEKAADDFAADTAGDPLELASALVRLSNTKNAFAHPPSVAFSGEKTIVEDRISRLLEIQTVPPFFNKTHIYLSCLFSFFISMTICISLFSQHFAPLYTIDCETNTCHMTECE